MVGLVATVLPLGTTDSSRGAPGLAEPQSYMLEQPLIMSLQNHK